MFQAVSPPIIRSSRTVHTASGMCQACSLLPLTWVSWNFSSNSPTLAVAASELGIYPMLCVKNVTFCWPCIMYWFLVNDQRDAQILFYVFISIYNSLHVSSTSCSSSGETNFINTASCKSFFFQPAHISATNIEWLLPGAVLIQFVSPDYEHDVLKKCRVINRNKYTEKNLCITLFIYQELVTGCLYISSLGKHVSVFLWPSSGP